jgi:hypothetical protein
VERHKASKQARGTRQTTRNGERERIVALLLGFCEDTFP